MKVKELRVMPKEELRSKLKELKKELMKHNAQIAIGAAPQNPGKVKVVKKSIARIMTIIKTITVIIIRITQISSLNAINPFLFILNSICPKYRQHRC